MKKRVVVAMSGGVDSSVAAALLRDEGYEVVGITLCFNLPDSVRKRPACCSIQGIEDARRVCHKLGIRHYVLNMQKELEKWVIADFCRQYMQGRTPNPCIRCNQFIKFAALLKKALFLDAQFLATGHYARIEKIQSRPLSKGRDKIQNYILRKGKDIHKDQSYFLYRLNQSQLKAILFPLGNYTKKQVRVLAKKFGLAVADKLASQEICFLPDLNYPEFLRQRIKEAIKPGLIADKEGNILGRHRGIPFYTIGQRQGLGIAKGYPLYVIRIDCKNNRIVAGRKADALNSEFLVKEPHFILRPLKKKIAAGVRIRYNHKETLAEIMLAKDKIKVKFKQPQFAITPGQSAVFYDRDKVLGGGIIDKVLG